MNIFFLLIIVILYAAVNAGMDYINFALDTTDAWHLLKFLDRFLMGGMGYGLAKIPKDEWKRLPWWAWTLIIFIFMILVKLTIWDTVYYSMRSQLTWFFLHCHLSTGIEWLDRFLGLHSL